MASGEISRRDLSKDHQILRTYLGQLASQTCLLPVGCKMQLRLLICSPSYHIVMLLFLHTLMHFSTTFVSFVEYERVVNNWCSSCWIWLFPSVHENGQGRLPL